MIGGSDIVVEDAGPPDEATFIVTELFRSWPTLCIQDASGDTCVLPGDETIATMTEFFVYKSRADFESWAADGASDANVDRMIHVMLGAKSTTFVTDGPGSSTYKLASALVPSMRVHRLVAALEAIRARVRAPAPAHPAPSLGKHDLKVEKGDTHLPFEADAA